MSAISLNFSNQLVFLVNNDIIEFSYNITSNDSTITLNKVLNESTELTSLWENLQKIEKDLLTTITCLNNDTPFLEKKIIGLNYQIATNNLNTNRFESDLLESIIINLELEV